MTNHQSQSCNSRQDALEPKSVIDRPRDSVFSKLSSTNTLESLPHVATLNSLDLPDFHHNVVPSVRKHLTNSGENTVPKCSYSEHDFVKAVAWTKKLDKFFKRPAKSNLLESFVTTSIASASPNPISSNACLPAIKLVDQRCSLRKSKISQHDAKTSASDHHQYSSIAMPYLHSTSLDQDFSKLADSADHILKVASQRRLTQIEFEAFQAFTRSTVLSSAWDDELGAEFHLTPVAGKIGSNRRIGRRGAFFKIPLSSTNFDPPSSTSSKQVKVVSLPLSQRSDVSVPTYLFDEEKSSKLLPDFNRIEKRLIIRQREFNETGALSVLGPNSASDSDPCSDECESPEKERVALVNSHKPTLIQVESGIKTVDHDELNAYSDFAYASGYQKAFAAEMASTRKSHLKTFEHHRTISKTVEEPPCMPETSLNWKTSMEMPDVAASEYCRFCILHKLPIYHSVIRASLTHSHHKNVSFSGNNILAVAHYFKHASSTIQELVIDSCSLGSEGFSYLGASSFHLMGSLCSLKLVDCNLSDSGNMLCKTFAVLSLLSSIQISDCKLRDTDCTVVLMGLARCNSNCTRIQLDHNLASTLSADAISKCFRYNRCCWRVLDFSWNRLSPSRIMCSSIRHCDHLTDINLSWNGFRDELALSALCYALRFHQQMRHITLQNCGLDDRHALLLTELLDDCIALVSMDLRSNSIRSYGCRSILRVLGLRHQFARKSDEVPDVCQVTLPISGCIPDSVIDYDVIAGPAQFYLRSPSDRHIIKRLLLKRNKNLISFADDSFEIDGKSAPVEKLNSLIQEFDKRDLQYHNSLNMISDFSNSCEIPKSEQHSDIDKITLIIQNLASPATEDRLATVWEIDFVKMVYLSTEFSMEHKVHFVSFLLGGSNVFRLEQLKELIFLIKPGYRIDAVKLALTHCFENDCSEQILSWLSRSEQQKVQALVSEELLLFSPNNPTGHYRLLLSNRFDRDICFKLLAIRNEIMDSFKRDHSYQSFRHKIEKVTLNVKLEGMPFTLTSEWNVPSNGTLELDFVYCLPPDPSLFPVIDDDSILGFTLAPESAQRKQIKCLRPLTNQYLFTCTQAMRILQYFRDDTMKVECLVILFSRVIDYPGFLRLVKALDGPKQSMLRKRLGSHNIYHDCNAVGFHELDLSDPQQRFVCARLVDLAVVEPGENMCGCRFNEIDFDVPSSWLEEVPSKGIFSVFYCRSAQVIKKIFSKIPIQCIPANLDLLSPPGTEWVAQAKRTRIKLKLSLAFTNVEDAFSRMDEDGGGSLSRLEFSRGLRMLGVQVTAYELLDLVELLDEDGSGFIELDEMVSFWESC